MFWTLICEELVVTLSGLNWRNFHEQQTISIRLHSVFPTLTDYFQGKGEGLSNQQINSQEFIFASYLIQILSTSSDKLMTLFLTSRANQQMVKYKGYNFIVQFYNKLKLVN
jgi:hypothetical protein